MTKKVFSVLKLDQMKLNDDAKHTVSPRESMLENPPIIDQH